jgi:hypothetical protein
VVSLFLSDLLIWLFNQLDAFPMELAHFEKAAHKNTEANAKPIAEEYIQQNRIPPTFLEVGQ